MENVRVRERTKMKSHKCRAIYLTLYSTSIKLILKKKKTKNELFLHTIQLLYFYTMLLHVVMSLFRYVINNCVLKERLVTGLYSMR